MTIPLITSIPPKLSRGNKSEEEIGEIYQKLCIRSWLENDFAPYSFNSNKESSELSRYDGVEYVFLERDASNECGKPLVYLDDMIRYAQDNFVGPFIITNGDIFLREIPRELLNVQKGFGYISKRVDVDDILGNEGEMFYWGYDLFILNIADLKHIPMLDMIFGLPWWDYVVPLGLLRSGRNISRLSEPLAIHLAHSPNWSAELWITMGKRAAAEFYGKPTWSPIRYVKPDRYWSRFLSRQSRDTLNVLDRLPSAF